MKTTLNEIRKYRPCQDGWETLLTYLNKTKPDDEPITFKTLREAIGIQDAVWCLRTQDYHDYCPFVADVAESVLPIFEDEAPDEKAPRKAIEAVRAYHSDGIKDELKSTSDASRAAADTAHTGAFVVSAGRAGARVILADEQAAAGNAAYTAAYAAESAYAAAKIAAGNTTYTAAYIADIAFATTAYAATAHVGGAANTAGWVEIERLYMKHFE